MASFFTKSLCSLFRGARTSIPTITKYSAAPITRWTPFSAVRAFHSPKSAVLFDPLDLAENGYSPCMSLLGLARAEQQQRQTAPSAKSSYTTSKPEHEQEANGKHEIEQLKSTIHLEGLDYSRSEDAYSEQLFSDDDDHSFLDSSYSPSFTSSYSTASPNINFAPSRSSTPLSVAEHTNAEPFSPIICPVARRPHQSYSPLLEIDLDEIPSSPSPTSEASFEDLNSSIRLISNSPFYPLFSPPSPSSDSDDGYTLIDGYSPTITTTPSERWSLTEVERAERGQASIIYEEEHLAGASKFYAPHLEVPRAKRVGGWGMPAWAEWSEEQVEAWAREEGI